MKAFMDKDFLLESETARTLYHNHAAKMPIFDYHSHLSPREIAENRQYSNLSELWLGGDHYKWRAMRSFGIDEKLISGDAPDIEKFRAYARMIPYTIGNPLHHWTHMELKEYFGIDKVLSEKTADEIWEESREALARGGMGARNLLIKSNVRVLCTTDDPADNLDDHRKIAEDPDFEVQVLPTFRPDKAMAFDNPGPWRDYMKTLGAAAGMEIRSYADLIAALENRHEFFHSIGGRISDHALYRPVYVGGSAAERERFFERLISGGEIGSREAEVLHTSVLLEIARMNREKGWTMQLHIGALRNNNSRMFASLGPDSGYDSIGDEPVARRLSRFLDAAETRGGLPRTIIYILNPADNYVIGTMIGNFQDGTIAGKIQFGSGWWFNDQRDGMVDQMSSLANLGLLSRFVGMLTDSRSFLSFPRHQYFRRILCNLIGGWVENGEYPKDMKVLGEIVENISYYNARNYFTMEES